MIHVKYTAWRALRNNENIPKLFMKNVAKNPNKTALIFEGKRWTFADVSKILGEIIIIGLFNRDFCL